MFECFFFFWWFLYQQLTYAPPPNLHVNPLVYVKFVDADHVAVVLWRAR